MLLLFLASHRAKPAAIRNGVDAEPKIVLIG